MYIGNRYTVQRDMISSKKQNSKKGFTLAEALVTLVIIGVIAALTIPAILVNTEQHEYKSALKSFVGTKPSYRIKYSFGFIWSFGNFSNDISRSRRFVILNV